MTDSLPARVADLETASGEFRSRLNGIERSFIDDCSRFVVRFERLEQALLGLQARVLAAEDDAPPPDPTRAATLREVLEIVNETRKHVPDDAGTAYQNGHCDALDKTQSGIERLLTAPAPQPPEPVEVSEVARLRRVLERDRAAVATVLNRIKQVIDGRQWLTEGRGSYAYDDDRWMDEFGGAIREIEQAAEPLRAIARDWSDCPEDDPEIRAARAEVGQRLRETSPRPPDDLFERLGHAIRLLLPLARGYEPEGQSDSAKRSCRAAVSVAESTLEEFAAYERERAKEQGRG